MAVNTKVGGKRTVSTTVTGVDLDASGEATLDVPELRHIENPEDVTVNAYGDSDTTSDEGRHVVVTSVGSAADGTTQVTIHSYIGGGTGAALDDDLDDTVLDEVQITARGL